MELSLAVNTSLIALARLGIFCTEPFRIPFSGKVDICCFDKTGTLTTDELVLRGVAGLADGPILTKEAKEEIKSDVKDVQKSEKSDFQIRAPSALPEMVVLTLAGCHSLIVVDGQLIGDPMEAASLKAIEWTLNKNDLVTPSAKASGRARGQVCSLYNLFFFLMLINFR